MAGIRIEELPLPTVVVEGDLVAQANVLAELLLGVKATELAGRPWTDFVAPEERERIAERRRRQDAGEPVRATYESAVLAAGGERIPVQLRVCQSGSRTVVHVMDLRGESRRRKRLRELAVLGAAVQRRFEDADVHADVRRGLLALDLHSAFTAAAGEGQLRVEWTEDGTEVPLLQAELGIPIIGAVRPMTAAAIEIWTEGTVFLEDWPTEAERFVGLPIAPLLRSLPPEGAFAHAIGMRIDVSGAPAGILTAMGDWVRPEDLPAFRLFGAQVSAALDAARAIRVLRGRNDDLRALNRLADAAASTPDFEGFLARAEDIVREAVGCNAFGVVLVDAERNEAALAHASRFSPELAALAPRMPLHDAPAMALFREGRASLRHAGEFGSPIDDAMRREGVGTSVGVPLRIRSGVTGLLVVDFLGPPGDAAGCRVDLLHAMASHFATAIEGHRLLDDLRRRVAELTLLNDIVVATGTLDPVILLDNALRRVAVTLRSDVAAAYLSKNGTLAPAALLGLSREELEAAPGGAGGGLAQLAVHRQEPVRMPGAEGGLDEARRRWLREQHGVDAGVAVPLLTKDRVLGALVLGRRRSEAYEDGEVRLLAAVAVQLGMALENARLFADTQRRMGDLEAVNSLALRMFTTAPGDAKLLLEATCKEIARALGAGGAVVLRLQPDGERLVGVAGWGTPIPADRIAIDLSRTPLAAEALRAQEPVWSADVVLDAGAAGRAPPLSVLFVPLTSRDATRGLVAIAAAPSRRFAEAEVALAYALASEAAMGLENAELYATERRRVEELSRLNEENARLYEDLRRSYAELAHAQEQLIRQERLAALGQLAAVVAHEVRNPLGVIFNSLGTLRRIVQPAGDARMLFDIVGEEADRLNRIVGDLLDFSRPSTPRLLAEPLDRVLDDAAAAALAGAVGVRLVRDVPADLPPVPMDARLMRQAVLNVMVNAVQAMPGGGTLTMRARPDGGAVRLEIVDTGCGIPEEVRHRVFEPFFTTRPTGTGLGLAVVKRILDDHRASAAVESVERGGTRFVVRLPIPPPGAVENEPGPWSI